MEYKICKRCIMDTSDSGIKFDNEGICNHCNKYHEVASQIILPQEKRKGQLEKVIKKIKEKGKNSKYDCVIGVSGGVDSTYTAYLVKELGLRPLAVHLDNGWDSELAVSNIEKAIKKFGIDLYTYIIDWEEFKDLQLSFLKASTPDSEIPTDHAIVALLTQTALKKGIAYVISGMNIATEAILPVSWSSGHGDWKYIKSIHNQFGRVKLRTFPHCNFIKWLLYSYFGLPKLINILNYTDYSKKEAIGILERELEWRDYGGKHCESIYTRFFQGYILPRKFGFDKRRAHLSSLICSGQITRAEALEEIKKDPYSSEELKRTDREYVIKKLGLTEKEFEGIMALPPKNFNDYPSYTNSFLYKFMRFFLRSIRRFNKG